MTGLIWSRKPWLGYMCSRGRDSSGGYVLAVGELTIVRQAVEDAGML